MMSLRLRLLNMFLRSVEKPRLARMSSHLQMRRGLARAASLMPTPPSDTSFEEAPASATAPRMLWVRSGPARDDCAVLYLHGGAFVAGSPDTHRSVLWPLSRDAGAPVVAPWYRLGPEHPFPAAFEDAMAAFRALAADGLDPSRIALAGDSAGGGLAFALAAALDAEGVKPAAVVGFSAFLDLTLSGASLRRNARREILLPVSRIPELVEGYLDGASPRDPRASPVLAKFRDPPPALLQVGSGEALRDESVRMAEAMRRAGGDVRLEIWRGTPHAFQFFAPWVRESREAVASAGAFLRAIFEQVQDVGDEEPSDAPELARQAEL